MKKAIIVFFVLLIMIQGRAFGDDKLSAIVEGIQKEYKDLPGLTIKYTREIITRTMSILGEEAKGDLATGTIYLKPPGYLKLEQETPESETVLVSGETIWWYVPKKMTVYRYPSQEFGKELRLLSDIFGGLMKVEEKFQIEMLPGDDTDESFISLRPEPPWQEVDHVVLKVTPGYSIVGVDIYNQLGGITRFKIAETVRTDAFTEGFFDFTVPEGVQVKEGTDQ